jgi:hypothetical protein
VNFSEHRMLERNRNQGNGEISAQPIGVELPPASCADLLDPALWQDGLAKYARATNLAVALADTAGRLIGSTINPRLTWSFLHSKTPPISSPSAGGVGCSFSPARLQPCNCVADALACGSRKPRRPVGSTQKGPLSASPIERVPIIFTAWTERRSFGADNSSTRRSHGYEGSLPPWHFRCARQSLGKGDEM